MDTETLMKTAGASAGLITAIGAIWAIIKKLNNKHFHSSCCGREMDVVVAVNDATPEERTPRSSPHITAERTPQQKSMEEIEL